jgi:DNA-binding NtrC family response regulator
MEYAFGRPLDAVRVHTGGAADALARGHRAEALTALTAERTKPKLLITDYLGLSMSVDQFLRRTLAVHPTLRILMASGFHPMDTRFSRVRPDRFIRKPFTAEEFLQEVRTSLF